MDLSMYLQFAAALVFVLGLIGCAAFMARRFGLGHAALAAGSRRRLGVAEVLPLDGRRKLVLLTCDDTEHLVILGQAGETVIDRSLRTVTSTAPAHASTFASRLQHVTSNDAGEQDCRKVGEGAQTRSIVSMLSEKLKLDTRS